LKNGRIVMFVLFLLLGIIIPVQVRGIIKEQNRKSKSVLGIDELITQINEIKDLNDVLKADLDEVQKEKEELTLSIIQQQSDTELEELFNSLKEYRFKAGLTDVTGPGIIIRLDDAAVRNQNADPSSLIIHDSDIKEILNDLKEAGAQAISINGERIVAMSEQICNGPTIKINNNRYAVPYEIRVIGDPDMLNMAMQKSERLAFMTRDRIIVNIKVSRNVFVPALNIQDNMLDLKMSYLEVVSGNEE
jgi:uncharacterized protein YlxW (UPF0749 family)